MRRLIIILILPFAAVGCSTGPLAQANTRNADFHVEECELKKTESLAMNVSCGNEALQFGYHKDGKPSDNANAYRITSRVAGSDVIALVYKEKLDVPKGPPQTAILELHHVGRNGAANVLRLDLVYNAFYDSEGDGVSEKSTDDIWKDVHERALTIDSGQFCVAPSKWEKHCLRNGDWEVIDGY